MKTLEEILNDWPSILSETKQNILDDILENAAAGFPNQDEYTDPQILIAADNLIGSIYDDIHSDIDPNYKAEDVIQVIYEATRYAAQHKKKEENNNPKPMSQVYKEIIEEEKQSTLPLMVGYQGNGHTVIGRGNNLISIKPYELTLLMKQLEFARDQYQKIGK